MRSVFIGILIMLLGTALSSQEKLRVVASASMIYNIAENIAGDAVDLDMIVPIGGDPHIHEPTPANAQLVNKADLILINGLTFEGWMNELIENSGTEGETVTVTEGVDVLRSLTYQNSADPHAWMVAKNGIIYADNIRVALSKLLPENTEEFTKNFNKFKQQLLSLDAYITNMITAIPEEQRILITSHDAFQYYGKAYGLRLEAIMGISTDAEAQTSDIVRVTNVIRDSKVPAIFVESTINPKMMKQIAKDNKVTIGGELFADSLGDEDSLAATYIDMLKYNTDTIVKALTGKAKNVEPEEKTSWLIYLGVFLVLVGAMFLGVRMMNR